MLNGAKKAYPKARVGVGGQLKGLLPILSILCLDFIIRPACGLSESLGLYLCLENLLFIIDIKYVVILKGLPCFL